MHTQAYTHTQKITFIIVNKFASKHKHACTESTNYY